MDEQLSRKANLFRLGYPVTKIPVQISMRLTTKDRFQELKEMVRHEKAKNYRHRTAADNGEDGTFSVMPIAAAATAAAASATSTSIDDPGKKRPGYESLMSRPRHFSQGHYMNMKPNGGDKQQNVNDGLTATVSAQVDNIHISYFPRTRSHNAYIPRPYFYH